MDHLYTKPIEKAEKRLKPERTASVFGFDHFYCKKTACITPTKHVKRKRDASTPTGKTPKQPTKIIMFDKDKKKQVLWTSEEKEYLKIFVQNTPKTTETLNQYWQNCADALNDRFPEHCRNGMLLSCIFCCNENYISTSFSLY